MSKYYCNSCSQVLGYLRTMEIHSLNLTGSTYQMNKYHKHTTGSCETGIVSVFNDITYPAYRQNTINALISGSTEIDHRRRINLLWNAHLPNGYTFRGGILQSATDLVKVVLPYEPSKIHSFPIYAGMLRCQQCIRCRHPIL
jgi:hypothetical protein